MRRSVARLVVGATAVALTLGACAQGTGGGSDDGTADAGAAGDFDPEAQLSGSLDVMGFGTGDEIATTRVDRAKEALGEDVEVKLVEGDLDIQQFLSAVASGQPPELIYANRDQIGTFASRGAIIPLTQCIAGEGITTDDFRDPAIDQVTFDGEIYGIPEFNSIQVTMANSELLDAAGLTIEDVNGSDWEALSAANEALKKGDGGSLSVIGYDSKLPEFLPLWAHANGTDLISEDGRTAQLNDPKVVEALEWAISIYDAQGGFPAVKAFRDSADFFGAGNQFAAGSLGAMPMEQWYINVLNDVSPDAPMAFDTVHDRNGEPIAYASGSAWAIPKGTDNPAAACRWARVMTEVDSWVAAAEARKSLRAEEGKPFTGVLTGNEAADEAVRELVEPSGDEVWDAGVTAMYEANDNTFSLPANPADAEFKTAWQDAVNSVLNGQAEPQEALDAAQETAQAALDQAWQKWEQEG
ncbi:carbohydrate ABC transporter substrate-binding protein (CUT1 family) [Georgenia soli]|uniref:Carbohydrate ABC transporter substrate-binding protein (CUT1 family) n=1 Tax=Georgenia soli TaxID=638953 RepID=A0A2A9ELX2_9MICO|nr:extracellular solute-binding protein [Georgenia soli]PFG39964.1 carbohydrate ABC transporter substrate-binding protein (CUT1 family) [Georgenia soli]